jgi:hypothetical protein
MAVIHHRAPGGAQIRLGGADHLERADGVDGIDALEIFR